MRNRHAGREHAAGNAYPKHLKVLAVHPQQEMIFEFLWKYCPKKENGKHFLFDL